MIDRLNKPAQTALPRWRGFNLLEAFSVASTGNFLESDFQLMAELGFDFVRLPMSYTLWTKNNDAFQIDEKFLEKIDRVIELGMRYGVHVNLNFHRAPGYSVNGERQETFSLWKDSAALAAFCLHWKTFARRYARVSSAWLSFNLVNEPPAPHPGIMSRADHERVVRTATAAIWEVDARRLILIDGLAHGTMPCPELIDLKVCQSCRAYAPGGLTHYRASWINARNFPEPKWPGGADWDLTPWSREHLAAFYEPWAELARAGVGVHCGEGGAFKFTPHGVVLGWMTDVIEILRGHNIGLALWNFRGPFGIIDSQRSDVSYDHLGDHLLDRPLLRLMQGF